MVAIDIDFPPSDVEEKVITHEAGVDHDTAAQLVRLGLAVRRLDDAGLREVASTRVLIAAGLLVREGLSLRDAVRAAVVGPLTDDPMVTVGLLELVDVYVADHP
jgi:nitric oxide reductase NorQ protein